LIVADKLIYLQLQKTGGAHISKLLQEILGANARFGQHDRLPDNIPVKDRMVIGSVRSPWDWYVSLWAYGCAGKGGLYDCLTSPLRIRGHGFRHFPLFALKSLAHEFHRSARDWIYLYRSSEDAESFRTWLYYIHDRNNRYHLGEGYARSPISQYAGLLTYRYVCLYANNVEVIYSKAVKSPERLKILIDHELVLNFTIRNERLEDDLVIALKKCGVEIGSSRAECIYSSRRTNVTQRQRDLGFYYDTDTSKLVRDRDQFIISKYGYEAPRLEKTKTFI